MKRCLYIVLAGILGVVAVERASARPGEESLFATLHRLESESARHRDQAETYRDRVTRADERLDELDTRRDVAERAARPIRQKFERVISRWESTMREVGRRSDLGASRRADTRHLLRRASARAIAPEIDDLDVLWKADTDERAHRDLVWARSRLTVRLAQHEATEKTKSEDREELVEKAREQKDRVRVEMKSSDQALHASLGRMLKNETTADFHRKKGTLIPPVSKAPVFAFGRRKQPGSMTYVRHTGYTYRVPKGTDVRAAAAGLVVYAERFEGFGNMVIVDHGSEYHTVYAHLAEANVKLGQEVERGETLGTSGASGSLEGPKLYFELRHDGEPVDPAEWFIQTK